MLNYNFTYKYDSNINGFIVYNNESEIGEMSLIVVFDIPMNIVNQLLNGIKHINQSYEKHSIMLNRKSIKFLTEYDAKLFIERLESILLSKILAGDSEELTVGQMIKLL